MARSVRMLKEPLVVFLLIAGMLFVIFESLSNQSTVRRDTSTDIIVSPGLIRALSASFETTWRRLPTAEELDDLVQSHIREEVFYREALAMGLDQNDASVKRVLRQKLEFLLNDVAELDPPTDKELSEYFHSNAEAYREQTRFTFQQIFFEASEKAESLAFLEQLRAGEIGADEQRQPTQLPERFDNEARRDIERVMGSDFVSRLAHLKAGAWEGPVESGLGYHLVYVVNRVDGRIAEFDQIRGRVERDWFARRRKEVNDAYYRQLRERYTVTTETPLPKESVAVSDNSAVNEATSNGSRPQAQATETSVSIQ